MSSAQEHLEKIVEELDRFYSEQHLTAANIFIRFEDVRNAVEKLKEAIENQIKL